MQHFQSTTEAVRFVQPQDITTSPDFQFRQTGIIDWHARELAKLIRNIGDLAPILLWQESDAEGHETGRLVLLDGHHRLHAYATARGTEAPVPAKVITGTPQEAATEAGKANTRVAEPLNLRERTDGAWRTVCLPGKRVSIPTVARAWGVGTGTISNMRARLEAMKKAGKQPTGVWWRDRQDDLPEMKDEPEMTDAERNALVEAIGEKLRAAMGKQTLQDETIAAEALRYAFGPHKMRSMTAYLFGEPDEFAPGVETVRTPTTASDGEF